MFKKKKIKRRKRDPREQLFLQVFSDKCVWVTYVSSDMWFIFYFFIFPSFFNAKIFKHYFNAPDKDELADVETLLWGPIFRSVRSVDPRCLSLSFFNWLWVCALVTFPLTFLPLGIWLFYFYLRVQTPNPTSFFFSFSFYLFIIFSF